MGTVDYNLRAIEQCRTAVGGQAGPMAAAGDTLPRDADAGVFGGLPSSAALAQAVQAIARTASDELDRAGALLGNVDRALDSVGQSVDGTEQAATQSLTAI
ncbi:hypothetical protein [Actinokineospora xionganensis]|uniref:Excreted virulence factor EspC (Type VII ESX diderm) n=1 Tax=Actinokineospora xionganensis TaxID=2684470 RepID=A0ABR7L2J7_9PSEU|nr:hypothetical protein [Actinokineospora xionganensis]MBC6446738.1 hypothetical protein [Actinokineospora xionganensis]